MTEVEYGVAQGGHGLWDWSGADAALILAQDDVASPVQAVLDQPVVAPQGQQGERTGFVGWQAGDRVGDLAAGMAGAFAGPFDVADLGGAGPVQMRHAFAAGPQAARFDAAVPFCGALGADQIGRRAEIMGGRKPRSQGLDQFRGEKGRQRQPQDQPSAPAGWL